MKKAILSLAILMSLFLTFSVSCDNQTQPPSGELPIWNIGDAWTVKSPFFAGGPDLLWVSTVTGEQIFSGVDCYTLSISCMNYSTGNTLFTRTSYIDKSTLYTIEREDYFPVNGSTYTIIETFSHNYSTKPYPYSVGKTWKIDCISNITTNISGNISTRNETNFAKLEVDKVETISVPAGTFQCFKVVQSDVNDSVFQTYWIDAVSGWIIKEIDSDGKTSELMSYSLAE